MPRFGTPAMDDEGYVTTLPVDEKNILSKWGVELSDADSYFIQGQGEGAAPYTIEKLTRSKNKISAQFLVHMATTDMRIEIEETFSPSRVTRTYAFTPLKDTMLTDIAISQGFFKDAFSQLRVDEFKIPFSGMERNHQYETERAVLTGPGYDLVIEFKSDFAGVGFVPVIYGRTSPKSGWVIHSRLFPKKVAKKAIVWCHPSWNKRVPFSDQLARIGPLADYLWYVGEDPALTKRRTFGFSSFGMVKVPAGTRITMTQGLTLVPHAKKKSKK